MSIYRLCLDGGDWFCKVPPALTDQWTKNNWVIWIMNNGYFKDLDYWRRVMNQRIIQNRLF